MSEANKQLVREKWEAFSRHDIEKLSGVYDENVVYYSSGGDVRRGRESVIDLVQTFFGAFSDLDADIEQVVAEGDFVVCRLRIHGTNTGELMGTPATGRRLDLRWVMNMVRIESGRVIEEWEVFDQADFGRQVAGVQPS